MTQALPGDDLRLELLCVEEQTRIEALYVEPPAHVGYLAVKAVVFRVDELDAFTDRLQAAGVTIVWHCQTLDETTRATLVRDPDGNLVSVLSAIR